MNLNVENIVEHCYASLSSDLQKHPWRILNHGYDILDTEEKLNAYIAAYGEMHINKCKKALQNFPFEDFCQLNQRGERTNVDDFEIYDWGCGQGIGTLTLLQYLHERQLLSGVSRINLIEPSEFALNRAEMWIKQSAAAHTEIRAFQRLIPSNNSELWNDIDCSTKKAIHLFSNILDIQEVGLQWLAKLTSNLTFLSYFICVGPQYGNRLSRIGDFYNYMGKPVCFTDFTTYPFGYTSRTNHPYGIEVKTFKYDNTSEINISYREKSEQKYYDEYNLSSDSTSGFLPKEIIQAYNTLKNEISISFEVFLRPKIGIEKPDFILCNISQGIVIVNVCDNISNFGKAFEQVEAIKQALFETYAKNLKISAEINPSVYNTIKTALFFTSATETEVEKACNDYVRRLNSNKEEKEIKNSTNPSPTTPKDPTKFLVKLYDNNCSNILMNIRANGFTFDFYQEIRRLITMQWHPFSDGDLEKKLTVRQKEILNNDSKRLRIRGVAGCGKTQLIAFKAVRENLRTSSKVLIVTYNIALINYIRMRINEVPADFSHSDFEIINYHQFFMSKARRYHGSNIPFGASDNPSFFDPYLSEIKKNGDQYHTIIVDEAQDFMTAWFDSLRNHFLTEDGTFLLFGDGEQNIFNRDMDPIMKMPRVNGFGGSENPWRHMSQRISMRMLNPKISQLATNFVNNFNLSTQQIFSPSSLNLYDFKIAYWNLDPNTSPLILSNNIIWLLSEYNLNRKDVVVLSQNIDILRETDKHYRELSSLPTIRTFESAQEFDTLKSRSLSQASLLLKLKAIRRVAKVHFTTEGPDLKFATIASFKGWESKTIILIIQSSTNIDSVYDEYNSSEFFNINNSALIYTAITRAKENLFIFNLNNENYHSFFFNNIQND